MTSLYNKLTTHTINVAMNGDHLSKLVPLRREALCPPWPGWTSATLQHG